MRVIAAVDEADIGDVKTGERVSFTVDAYPDDTFAGTVTQVRQRLQQQIMWLLTRWLSVPLMPI